MYNQLLELINSNQFLQGGMLIGAAGAALAYARGVPGRLYNLLVTYLTVSISIRSDDEMYENFVVWLGLRKEVAKKRVLRARTPDQRSGYPRSSKASKFGVLLSLGEGNHWFRKGTFVYRVRMEKDDTKEDMGGTRDLVTIQAALWHKQRIVEMVRDAQSAMASLSNGLVKIYTKSQYESGWDKAAEQAPRDLDTVVLKAADKQLIVKDIETFLTQGDEYLKYGIPYQRGYLLYGPPGTGKTSLVYALASKFKRRIYTLSLSDVKSDTTLAELIHDVPEDGILLIEDIDSSFVGRVAQKEEQCSFAGLLNALSGVVCTPGRLLFITTNNIDQLDSALIRPGRVDMQLHMGLADTDMIKELYVKLTGSQAGAAPFAEQYTEPTSPATVVRDLWSKK